MTFHSWLFLLFFLLFYFVYLGVKRTRFSNLWLVICSYVFYGWWQPWFLLLIFYSTVVDYFCLWMMSGSVRKKLWLTVSILNSLTLLIFFKYSFFFIDSLNTFFSSLGTSFTISYPGFFLPVGLSFYLFKSIGYVVDCYRGEVDRERNFIRHAAFVSFFPILLSGPIERAKNLFGQLRRELKISVDDVASGGSLFVVGLFKKLALADSLGLYVDKVYGSPGEFHSPALILATFAFGWQLYFDFGGYTDMARGISRMTGFKIMRNFEHPYLSGSLRDFWRRWHISLSSWFRDYVYIPLGGNRRGKLNTHINTVFTMLLLGLWHGSSVTFLFWGLLHGIGRCFERLLDDLNFDSVRIWKFVKPVAVFVFVTFGWIFFRAANWDTALLVLERIFTSGFADPRFPLVFLLMIVAVWLYEFGCEKGLRNLFELRAVRIGTALFMLIYLAVFVSSGRETFIYFQF